MTGLALSGLQLQCIRNYHLLSSLVMSSYRGCKFSTLSIAGLFLEGYPKNIERLNTPYGV